MQGREGRADWFVGLILFACFMGGGDVEADAAAIPPRYRLVDLGPAYTEPDADGNDHLRFGSFPKIDNDGNVRALTYPMTAGEFKLGPIEHPEKPWLTIGSYLRKGDGPNLLPDELGKLVVYSRFKDLTAAGEAVGYTNDLIPFFFDSATGETIVAKPLPGRPSTDAHPPYLDGMNSLHQLVGSQDHIPTLYTDPRATPLNLADLIDDLGTWNLSSATGINDLGQIVGLGFRPDLREGRSRYYRLDPLPTPVPEPGSWLLFALLAAVTIRAGFR